MHIDLLATALELLCPASEALPTRSAIRRSVSTTYYAMFHHISRRSADLLAVGRNKILSRAQMQVYRSIDHRDIVAACITTRQPGLDFPKSVVDYSAVFLNLHRSRASADYDPTTSGDFHPMQAFNKIAEAEDAIRRFDATAEDDRKAFAVLIAVKRARNDRSPA